MKRVLLDCDGVLSDFIGPVLDLVHQVTGRLHTREEVDRFDFAKCLGLTEIETRLVFDTLSNSNGWWRALPMFDGAEDGVARLREVAEVYIVTSPWWSCATWLGQRLDWLYQCLGILGSHVVITSAKHLVAGDVLVDDKTSTLIDWQLAHGRKAVQWITPHNRLDGWTGPATNSWEQLVEWCR